MNQFAGKMICCFAALAMNAALAQDPGKQPAGVKFRPDEIVYKKNPLGVESAVLYGDPTKAGLFVQRVKIPAGFKVPPHWHPDSERTLTVMSGTLYFGLGERWDESKMEPRPAGTFFAEVPKVAHYVWAKDGEVVLNITGMGPTGITTIEQPK